MKKILKKIGVFGIIVAILAPFITLPKVNAAESCERHLQSYLFIDVINGNEIEVYEDGYRTVTSFLYSFPDVSTGQTVKIESTELFPLDDVNDIKNYWNTYNVLANGNYKSNNIDHFGTYDAQSFTNSEYKDKTTILHGVWARENTRYEDSKHDLANHPYQFAETESVFTAHSIQGVLINKKINQDNFLNVTTGGGTLVNNKFYIATEYDDNVGEFLQLLIDDTNSDNSNSLDENYLWDHKGDLYLNLNIERQIDADNLNKLNYGYIAETTVDGENKKFAKIFTTDSVDSDTKVYDQTGKKNIINSYDALVNSNNQSGSCDPNKPCNYYFTTDLSEIDVNVQEAYYWPVILNIEYSVCTNTEEAVKWTLQYNENVRDNSVTNMPSPKTETYDAGVSATVSSTKPERKNYTFDKWCTEENGSGDCYTAGNEIKNSGVSTTVTLYAQWKEVGTTENKKTGVISYVIGFAAVGLVAGGIYLVSKKKNLFKQI